METKSQYSVIKLLPVLFSFFVMGFVDVVGISVSYVKKDFTLNDTTANLLPMLVFLWFAVCSLPVGIMMRRIGRKKTVLISAIITAAGMLIPLLNYSFPIILTAFALLGIGNTILQVSLNPLVTNVSRADKLTSMLTLGQFIKAISSALGPVLVGFAAASLGNWQYIFPIYAVVTALSFVWLVFTPIHEEKIAETNNKRSILNLFKDKYLLILFTAILLSVGFEVGLMTAVPKYFQESYALSLETGGYACTLYFIARTIGTFGGAVLLSRLPVKRFFIVSLVIGIGSFLAFLIASNTTMLYISLFTIGLGCANIFPVIFSTALQYKKEYTDEISAMMIMGVSGGALIPPLMGILADASTQQISLIIPLCALIYILFVAIYIIKK
ncbi:MFS transporter [Dysgonomonas sp. 521]|uniref:MFS transporter n=1 Tax=Dysgonomonas sp. 521 TaxID=2302932 RepID=UPI0013D5FF5D|nr:MFS transporter [Dysgonomonas sp. 521]NDV95282.1 MFS transporter [Dysgonomonas sp. 521]